MAGALVGGAFLSGFINVVFDRFLSSEAANLIIGKKLGPDLVERLRISLHAAEALVDDAEYKQLDNPSVKDWLNSLREVVYVADDLLDSVLTIEATRKELSVIPIVGIGGVGKTTLAQWLYNNDKLMEGFQVKEWVCISEHFDIAQVTKNIIGQNARCIDDFNSLQLELKEKLSAKKFFIVLDDVWSDDGDVWKKFKTPFQYGAKGSTILVTTRVKEVASVVQTCPPYVLSELSEDCCWSVFANNACFPESNGSSILEEIGRKIVKKCKGLPLAVETLGRMLRTKHNVKEWEDVLISDIWEFSVKNSKIIPALLISYFHLPAHLKRCFVHCSLYPKDYDFDKAELILLWMAEDLLRPPKRGESLEEVGCECFDELASRLFFKQHKDSSKNFVMHDLLHDLALFLAGDFYCRFKELGDAEHICPQTRHLSYESLSHLISNDFDSISKVESLRTFLPTKIFSCSDNIDCVTCILISKLKYLRVLSFLWFTKLDVLPDSIGELIHLRYLDLSWTYIKTLPESLCSLCNLQTLKLYYCRKLATLPSGLHNLVSLRHLDIRGTSLEEMPGKMSKLNQLHILSYFVVGKYEDNGIQELGGLVNLHGSVEIKKLENIVDVKEAMRAKIMDKKHIDELCLEWSSGDDLVSSTQKERDILDKLQPRSGLKVLRIWGYKGTIFPDWLGNCSYENMTRVSLKSCKNCCMLPSLGQLPSLKLLRIRGFGQLRSIGEEFYKNEGDHHSSRIAPFPSLETLEFDNMACWESPLPSLHSLKIKGCPNICRLGEGGLPPNLKSLEVGICEQQMRDLSWMGNLHALTHLTINGYKYYFVVGKHKDNGIQELGEMSNLQGSFEIRKLENIVDVKEAENARMINKNLISKLYLGWSLGGDMVSNTQTEREILHSLEPHNGLKELTIRGYRGTIFPDWLGHCSYNIMTHVSLESCNNCCMLPSLGQLPSLKSLYIQDFGQLSSIGIEFYKDEDNPSLHIAPPFPLLEILTFDKMACWEELEEGDLPPNLKVLEVGICEEQMRDLSWMPNLHALTRLIINGSWCKSIKSYPELIPAPYAPIILFYTSQNDTNTLLEVPKKLELLKQSLSETLTQFYPLGGKIKHELSIDCNDEGANFVVSKVKCHLSVFLSHPNLTLLHKFLPSDELVSKESNFGTYVTNIQVNVFQCGGIAIGTRISHRIIDGAALATFLKCWSERARGCKHLTQPKFIASSVFPTNSLWLRDLSMGMWGSLFRQGKGVTKRFLFTNKAISTLKVQISAKYCYDVAEDSPTRLETVSAILWKCLMAASQSRFEVQRSSFVTHLVNLRRRMDEALCPDHTMGNLVWLVSAKHFDEHGTSMDDLACKLRNTISRIDKDFVNELRSEKGISIMKDSLRKICELRSRNEMEHFGFSSWCNLGFYEADFGWGKPTWVSSVASNGSVFMNLIILVDTKLKDGIEAWVTLDEHDMNHLISNTEILNYATLNPSPLAKVNKSFP
ncbi:hypothetical protein AHAS_Ahas12G0017400 [Arachis hypogaea]